MIKKLYKIIEKKTSYRIHYAWAEDEDDLEEILCDPKNTLEDTDFEPEDYDLWSREVKDDEEFQQELVLNPEDKEKTNEETV